MNTFLSCFVTLVTSSPLWHLLPQCTLVPVKIRFTICPGRQLGSELASTTGRSCPEPSNCPTGVPNWLSRGSPEDILAHRVYVAGKLQEAGTFQSILFLGLPCRSDLGVNIRGPFVFATESGVWRRCRHCEQLLSFQTPTDHVLRCC